jgi:RimJ/RimL family protein N-acetyltransferase
MRPMIHGERVRLRRVDRSDLPRYVEWLNDPDVRDHLALVHPIGLAGEEQWFEATLHTEPACQPFAIDARGADLQPETAAEPWVHIGSAGFHEVDWRNRAGELGLVIGRKDLWGRGYGTEAVRVLARWGFFELNLHRVQLKVYEDNARAIRAYEKAGFKVEGCLRQARFHEGGYHDTLVMGLLREELR